MKKSNKTLSLFASIFLLASFIFSPLNAVFAEDAAASKETAEPKEAAAKASDDAKKAEGGDEAGDKKKKGEKGEEPDCD